MRVLLSYLVAVGRWVWNAASVVAIELAWEPVAEWWNMQSESRKQWLTVAGVLGVAAVSIGVVLVWAKVKTPRPISTTETVDYDVIRAKLDEVQEFTQDATPDDETDNVFFKFKIFQSREDRLRNSWLRTAIIERYDGDRLLSTAAGHITLGNDAHGKWAYVDMVSLFDTKMQWFWYGQEITEEEWNRRNTDE